MRSHRERYDRQNIGTLRNPKRNVSERNDQTCGMPFWESPFWKSLLFLKTAYRIDPTTFSPDVCEIESESNFHGMGYAPQEYAVLQICFEDINMHI